MNQAVTKTFANTIRIIYYMLNENLLYQKRIKIIRSHWAVENKIHWHLDYTFNQDRNKTTNKNALLNLEIIHKFVLAELEKKKYIIVAYL